MKPACSCVRKLWPGILTNPCLSAQVPLTARPEGASSSRCHVDTSPELSKLKDFAIGPCNFYRAHTNVRTVRPCNPPNLS